MTSKEYYKKEFDKLGDLTKVSFKFNGWTDSTKEINLNLESIEELEKFIKKAKKELKGIKCKK